MLLSLICVRALPPSPNPAIILVRVILINLFQYCGGLIGASQADSFAGLMVARVIHGFGSGVCEALPVQLVNDIFFLHERGARLGYYTGETSLIWRLRLMSRILLIQTPIQCAFASVQPGLSMPDTCSPGATRGGCSSTSSSPSPWAFSSLPSSSLRKLHITARYRRTPLLTGLCWTTSRRPSLPRESLPPPLFRRARRLCRRSSSGACGRRTRLFS